jgi:hypothetical protein
MALFGRTFRRLSLLLAAAVVVVTILRVVMGGHGADGHIYWAAWQGEMYDVAWHDWDAYVYSPAFAQALGPLSLLAWPAFLIVWTTMQVALLVLMAGPIAGALLLLPAEPVYHVVRNGNIDLMVGLAIALGFRWPATWAFVLLTKVTPGVGLIWFAARHEWKSLGIALGTTLAIVGVSATVAPQLWRDWIGLLIQSPDNVPPSHTIVLIPLPLAIRLPIGAAIVFWAARTNRPWAVVLGGFVAAPLASAMRASMLVAVLPLVGWGPLAAAVRMHRDRSDNQWSPTMQWRRLREISRRPA